MTRAPHRQRAAEYRTRLTEPAKTKGCLPSGASFLIRTERFRGMRRSPQPAEDTRERRRAEQPSAASGGRLPAFGKAESPRTMRGNFPRTDYVLLRRNPAQGFPREDLSFETMQRQIPSSQPPAAPRDDNLAGSLLEVTERVETLRNVKKRRAAVSVCPSKMGIDSNFNLCRRSRQRIKDPSFGGSPSGWHCG